LNTTLTLDILAKGIFDSTQLSLFFFPLPLFCAALNSPLFSGLKAKGVMMPAEMVTPVPDEEEGRHRSLCSSINTEDSSSDEEELEIVEDGRFASLLSVDASFNTTASETHDRVTELASLVGNGAFATYGTSIRHKRSLSDESIATVAALPGMILRAHSVTLGKHDRCVIRHSVPKVGEYYFHQLLLP
jgi:hypothetical protein